MGGWWSENWQWAVSTAVVIALALAPFAWRRWRAARATRWHVQPQTDCREGSCAVTVTWMLEEPALDVSLEPAGGARLTTWGGSSARRLDEGETRMAVFRWREDAPHPRAVLTWREAGLRNVQRLEFDLRDLIKP